MTPAWENEEILMKNKCQTSMFEIFTKIEKYDFWLFPKMNISIFEIFEKYVFCTVEGCLWGFTTTNNVKNLRKQFYDIFGDF